MLFVGAMIVVALLLSPLWIDKVVDTTDSKANTGPFPAAFNDLSNEAREMYNNLYGTDRQKAIDLVGARLTDPVDVEDTNLLSEDPNPSAVQQILTGEFLTLDPMRGASGRASIYRLSDGRYVVRLENLDAINGPDLHVLLTAVPGPATREDLDEQAQFEIDLTPDTGLKGNKGNQNYFITDPAFNVDNYMSGSIVLYSTRYEMVFSFATLLVPS